MKPQGLKDLEARIARLFAEQLQVELPTPEADLFESGLLDSWRLVVLLGALEAEFGVRVAMEEMEFDDVRTLAQIASFVAARVPPKAGRPPSYRVGTSTRNTSVKPDPFISDVY